MQKLSAKRPNWEIYSGLRARAPLVARADGRGFKKILENRKKPYDMGFARSMSNASIRLFLDSGLSPALAFAFSDEISIVFLNPPFAGRIEKIDSIVASFLSSALSLDMSQLVCMDCRTIPVHEVEIVDYLADRQGETWRNHVFSYGFYMLVNDGLSASEAMDKLRGLREHEIHELVYQRGINLAKTPAWERRGILIYRTDGHVVANWEPPLFSSSDGKAFLVKVINDAKTESND